MEKNPKAPERIIKMTTPKKTIVKMIPKRASTRNIKALQQVISAKDVELKKAQDDLKIYQNKTPENEKSSRNARPIKTLAEQIGEANKEKRREVLEKAYPDIVPECFWKKPTPKLL